MNYINQLEEENANTTVDINDAVVPGEYFNNFNWSNFEYGDKVYLDDCDETTYLVARFRLVEETETGRIVHLTAVDKRKNLKSTYR
jgi:hypothetical protein